MPSSEHKINDILATVALRIRESFDIETVLQTAVREVYQLLKCDRVLIYRFEENGSGTVTVEAVSDRKWSILGNVIRNPCFESPGIEGYQQGKVLYFNDIQTNNINDCHRKFLQQFNVQANFVAPILLPQIPSSQDNLAPSRLWGLLIAHQCQQPRQWLSSEINLLKQLATHLAIAIQQGELLQYTDRELRERRLAEKQIQQVRKFLQTVIDSLPIAVYVKDGKKESFGKFQLWNKATEQIFNIKAPQALGKTAYDYFPIEQAQDFCQEDLDVFCQGKATAIIEDRIQNEDREAKIIHKVKVPLYDEEQQPEHLLCIAEDITDRTKAEIELRQKSEELIAFSNNLKLLHRLNTTNYQSFEELFRDHLQKGCQMFNCSTGMVGLIKGDRYTIYAIESDMENLHPQMEIALEDTYCKKVVLARKTISFTSIGEMKELCRTPVYQNFKFESYIGAPIFVDGDIFGTLCFTAREKRERAFSDREKETLEMMAESIGRFIFANQVEQKRQQAEALLTQTKKELEIRVLQRTAELEIANHRLQEELQERKQIQAELQASQDSLQESERRWRSLLENVRLLVVGIDTQSKVNYVNPYFLELTGYSQAEIIDRNWIDYFVHPQDRDECREIYQNIVKLNSFSHDYHQKRIVTKFQEVKTIAWNTTQLRDIQGTPIGMMCIGKDITQSQAIERMKDEFISVVSHELRTPLTSIRGALGLLATGVLNQQLEKKERVIKIAAESTEHLVRLVDDILELERLGSGKTELIKQQINLQNLLSKAVNRVQILANKNQIEIKVTKTDGNFWGDSDRLIQVLTNLLSNAIKFSEAQSTVWLDANLEQTAPQSSQQLITFTVRDRGRGIPSDKLESIFERFHQVDASDSRRKGGTGLGLAICRSIVEQHQGKIWVESFYGKGSAFYFSVPVSARGY